MPKRSVVKLPTLDSCFCVTSYRVHKKEVLDLKDDIFFRLNTIFIYYLFASSRWNSRYHSTRLVDLRKWAPLYGEISWEKKILLLSKKIASFTSQNKLLKKTLECWVCKQPRILRGFALFWCFKWKQVFFTFILFLVFALFRLAGVMEMYLFCTPCLYEQEGLGRLELSQRPKQWISTFLMVWSIKI